MNYHFGIVLRGKPRILSQTLITKDRHVNIFPQSMYVIIIAVVVVVVVVIAIVIMTFFCVLTMQFCNK